MPLESTGGLGGEFMIIDDDNPHDGKGPKWAVIAISSSGDWVYDADAGFSSKDKQLQAKVNLYFERKNQEEYEQLMELRHYEQIATNDYGREKMRYIIDD